MQEKEKLQKSEVEVIKFEETDVIATSTGMTSFTGTGQGATGGIPNPPPIPMP